MEVFNSKADLDSLEKQIKSVNCSICCVVGSLGCCERQDCVNFLSQLCDQPRVCGGGFSASVVPSVMCENT